MTDPAAFTKLVPGFEFMQNMVKTAGAAIPGFGQWVAPTIDPDELAKRIEELRTVQFWLEQNARMLGATIQAMEVQRMTLSTLKTMNVQMDDLRDSLKITIPGVTVPAKPSAQTAATPDKQRPAHTQAPGADAAASPSAPPAVDPMQWWGALARQFTDIATQAMKDPLGEATRATGATTEAAAPVDAAPSAPDTADKLDARSRAAKAPGVKKATATR